MGVEHFVTHFLPPSRSITSVTNTNTLTHKCTQVTHECAHLDKNAGIKYNGLKCLNAFVHLEHSHTQRGQIQLQSMFVFVFFQQLYRKRPGMTMLCAKLPQNVSKNRYRDISPCTSVSALLMSSNMFPLEPFVLPITHSTSPPLFFFPPLEPLFFLLCRLFSLFLYVHSYPLLLSSWLPLQMMPRGSF